MRNRIAWTHERPPETDGAYLYCVVGLAVLVLQQGHAGTEQHETGLLMTEAGQSGANQNEQHCPDLSSNFVNLLKNIGHQSPSL